MNVGHFFHVIRSAARVTGATEFTVFGTAASIPWLKGDCEFWPSMEVDIDAGSFELNTEIDGAIGENSTFHETHGIYAHGVSVEAFSARDHAPRHVKALCGPNQGCDRCPGRRRP